ncbi:unnamed protein product, partial [Didymodactylos carnosus]
MQIRHGGSKGTLCVKPVLDDEKYEVVIRNSMKKFETDYCILEICKLSSPRPLYLNRQDIILLSHCSIPDSNFFVLQKYEKVFVTVSVG